MSNSNNWYTVIQWVFSGIGVAVVLGVSKWLYSRYSKPKDEKVATVYAGSSVSVSGSTVTGPIAGRDVITHVHNSKSGEQGWYGGGEYGDSEYRETPTPIEMTETIEKVSLYLKQGVADTYAGLKVRWKVALGGIHLMPNGIISVALTFEDGTVVVTSVALGKYPLLKTVRGGEPVEIMGEIDHVQPDGVVHLKDDARLRFL